jgi:hypothetical protein
MITQDALFDVSISEGIDPPDVYNRPAFMEGLNLGNSTHPQLDTNYSSILPSSSPSIIQNIQAFLFPFQIMLNWVLSAPAVLIAFFTTVPTFLAGLGLPMGLVFALSAIWYMAGIVSVMLTFIK